MKQLSGLDSAFLNLETAAVPMHVGSLAILELAQAPKEFGFDAVCKQIRARLPVLPELRRRLKILPLNLAPALWVEDPDFRLSNHVHRCRLSKGDDQDLAETVADCFSRCLERSRPLWAVYFIEGLKGRRAACLSIVHHACMDGIGGSELIGRLMDSEPRALPSTRLTPRRPEETGALPGQLGRLLLTARHCVRRPLLAARLTQQTWSLMRRWVRGELVEAPNLRSAPRTRLNVTIDAHRSYAFRSLALAPLQKLRRQMRVNLNDVLLTICAQALRDYLQQKSELPEAPLVAAVPVSVRGRSGLASANQVSVARVCLHTDIADPIERLRAIHTQMMRAKRVTRAVPPSLLMRWAEVPAPSLVATAARALEAYGVQDRFAPAFNLVISNVPGPRVPLSLAGARVSANYPLSIPYHGLAVNITALRSAQAFDIGLTAHRGTVPDVEDVMDLIEAAARRLGQLAETGAAPAIGGVVGDTGASPEERCTGGTR
jgi:WS/DGAT/MGAT family acyltransferase